MIMRPKFHVPVFDCVKVFKALSDPTRLRIVQYLVGGEKCVSELSKKLRVDQPAVSHHLSSLKRSGLLSERRQGKNVYYRIDSSLVKHLSSKEDRLEMGCCAVDLRKR